jgi:hypothetical protein
VKVEVEGVADASGVVVADEVEIEIDKSIRVEAVVTSVDGAAGIVVTQVGLAFEVRPFTELKDERDGVEPFALNNLIAGDRIEARGFLEAAAVVAVKLERVEPEVDALLRGPVTAIDEPGGRIEILGVSVVEQSGVTTYEDLNKVEISRAEFFNLLSVGHSVEAKWDIFVDTTRIADKLRLKPD